MKHASIFEYAQSKEVEFNQEHGIYSSWSWSWKRHIEQSFFYLYGRLLEGDTENTPVKNIIRPIVNVAYRAEDVDIKDVSIYVNEPEYSHLSFLVKKYHDEVFVKQHDLDGFIDEVKEEKINYGGALAQKMKGARPKKIDLQNICFGSQSDLMSEPFGILMPMTPSELMDMKEQGWGQESNGATISVENLISLHEENQAQSYKSQSDIYQKKEDNTLKIYQIWGVLPAEYVGGEEGKYTLQLHYIAFYKGVNDVKIGVSLFSKTDKDTKRFKFVNRDKVHNRALGYGGVEELFQAQAWNTASMIWRTDMLRAASKMIMQTADSNLVARHPSGLKDLDNFEVLEHEEGKPLTQVDTFPRNYQLFLNANNEWEEHARTTGSASEPLLGKEAPSGTPFRAQERQVMEGKGIHEYRRGKYARFIEELYTDWWIPYIASELRTGQRFLAELTRDEMDYVSDCLVRNTVARKQNELVLNGELPMSDEQKQAEGQRIRDEFMRKGNKHFMELLAGELDNVELKVQVSVMGKSKNLSDMSDKLTNVIREVIANPAILQDPNASKLFNKLIEYSGLDPISFSSYQSPQMQAPQQNPAQQNQQVAQPQPQISPASVLPA